MARETPVFISYARADERYATELMRRLAAEPDIAPWQDRIKMAAGDFEEQIKGAIDSSEYFVLVMTPGALRSPWVEREWRYARSNGRCIVPIVPTFDVPETAAELATLRATLPVWMQNTQTYDFAGYWKRFVALLQAPCQATRTPFMVDRLPANFVSRKDEFDRIVGKVLDDTGKNPSGRTVVLHGAGGFGKTTLALSVCHDKDVFAACDGGILWVTLGEQPEILTQLERLYAALTGDRPAFKDQDDAMFEVARKLEGKRCLLVIDDVWRIQDLKPFVYGAPSTSRVVTTRVFSVAINAAPDERDRIDVGEVTPEEAERMLSAGLPEVPGGRVRYGVLASRLRHVPLLLQLANRCLAHQVALGDPVERALEWALRKYTDLGVTAFDETAGEGCRGSSGRRDAVRETVAQTVEVSLQSLGAERERCVQLGVLHEDTEIPFPLLGTLWELDEVRVQAAVQRFHDFGLILLDLQRRTIRLHDYIREYFERILPDRATVHGRLVDAWTRRPQVPAGYPVQHIVFHLVEAMTDGGQLVRRARQLIDLLSDARFERYQRQHGDATALDRKLTLAITRAGEVDSPEVPPLIASLVLLRKSYATRARDAARVFQAAALGELDKAIELLALFEVDRHWNTLTRLLIAWAAPQDRANKARALLEETAPSCDNPQLRQVLAWARQPPGAVPPGLAAIVEQPNLRLVSALLRRAGGAEAVEGLEPLSSADLASGTDASGFIAERDGPVLVAFAQRDPANNMQYLEQYIDIHAANRYAHYRNRSLWMLLEPILQIPDPPVVQRLLLRIATSALTVATVDFEEFLPMGVRGLRARAGDAAALADLEGARRQLTDIARTLDPERGRTDSWSHYQRRASALAEIFARALQRAPDAADLLTLARNLPKGFAGFRAPSALTLADSTRVVAMDDAVACQRALTSALAASHRIQDHRFCLQVAAAVNAIRARWSDMRGMDLQAVVDRFVDNPHAAEFCAIHRVLDQFEFRAEDQQYFHALPIPDAVRQAQTLAQIAGIFEYKPDDLVAVNDWIYAGPAGVLDEVLQKDDEVYIPDPEFAPILAGRFAAEAIVAEGLSAEARRRIVQRLVPVALSNRTATDTILGRMMLMLETPADLPPMLAAIAMPDPAAAGSPGDYDNLMVL